MCSLKASIHGLGDSNGICLLCRSWEVVYIQCVCSLVIMDAVCFLSDTYQQRVCVREAMGTGLERSNGEKMFLSQQIAVGSSETAPHQVSAKVSTGRGGAAVAKRVCELEQRVHKLP